MRSHVPIIYLVDSAGVNLALPGRRVSRPVWRVADFLLQLNHAAVSEGPADLGGDGTVHRRRCLSAGAFGCDRHG